jgi:hypothetical protein
MTANGGSETTPQSVVVQKWTGQSRLENRAGIGTAASGHRRNLSQAVRVKSVAPLYASRHYRLCNPSLTRIRLGAGVFLCDDRYIGVKSTHLHRARFASQRGSSITGKRQGLGIEGTQNMMTLNYRESTWSGPKQQTTECRNFASTVLISKSPTASEGYIGGV